MRLGRRNLIWWSVAALVFTAAVSYAAYRPARLRNFGVVKDDVLLRSGQLTPNGLKRALQEGRIKSVVTLRPVRDQESNPDTWEEELCKAHGVNYFRCSPGEGSGEEGLNRMAEGFLAVMDDPANHPVLVHCLAGRDRTGTMCAIYRMEFDRWPSARAAEEMQRFEFDPNKDPAAKAYERYVLGYLPRRDRKATENK